MKNSVLYIFSGLPATGKSTLAKKLVVKLNATYIRIDTIEQGLRDICNITDIEGKGYRLSYLIAKDNLNSGNHVVADSVNPCDLSRKEWNEVATSAGANYINIEIICSDKNEHKDRVENRNVGIKNLKLPTWKEVLDRDYQKWEMPRITIDTSKKNIEESFNELIQSLNLNFK